MTQADRAIPDRAIINDEARRFIEDHHPYTWEEMLHFPKYIDLDVINTCNARCTMCGIDFDNREKRRMSETLFEKIADDLGEHRNDLERVGLAINSEPLMDRGLHQKVAKLKQVGIAHTFILTNASLLSRKRSEELLSAGLDTIYVSIDSTNKETFEGIRRGLKFDDVRRNARNFLAARKDLEKSCHLRISMVQQRENAGEAREFVDYWSQFVDDSDEIVVTHGYNWGIAQDVVTEQGGGDDPNNRIPCLGLWTSMVVDVNGEVRMCCIDQAGTTMIGDLNENSISEVWHGDEMRGIRQRHLDGKRREISYCDGCSVWSPAKHLIHTAPFTEG